MSGSENTDKVYKKYIVLTLCLCPSFATKINFIKLKQIYTPNNQKQNISFPLKTKPQPC